MQAPLQKGLHANPMESPFKNEFKIFARNGMKWSDHYSKVMLRASMAGR